MVSVKISGERSLVYENVVIRVDKNNAEIECHLDIEEAKCGIDKKRRYGGNIIMNTIKNWLLVRTMQQKK